MTSRLAAPEKSLVRVYVWIIALVTLLTVARRPRRRARAPGHLHRRVADRGALGPDSGRPDRAEHGHRAGGGDLGLRRRGRSGAARQLALGGCPGTEGVRHRRHVGARHRLQRVIRRGGVRAGPTRSPTATWRRATPSRRSAVASVISSPGVPEAGGSTDYVLIVAIGLLVGLALGIGAAWLWDRVSDRVRSSRELEKAGPPRVVSAVSRAFGRRRHEWGRQGLRLPRRPAELDDRGPPRGRAHPGHGAPRRSAERAASRSTPRRRSRASGAVSCSSTRDLSSRGSSSLDPGQPLPGASRRCSAVGRRRGDAAHHPAAGRAAAAGPPRRSRGPAGRRQPAAHAGTAGRARHRRRRRSAAA